MSILTALLASCVGAYVGKFMAMIITYLPPILLEGCDKGREPRDIFKWFWQKPFCFNCKQSMPTKQGIPIVGYLSALQKCPKCKFSFKKTFALEISIALLFGLLTLFFGLSASLVFVCTAICILICCFFTDYEYSILPDQLTLLLVWVGLVGSLFHIFLEPHQAILGAIAGYGIFWILNEIYYYFRHKVGMYPGDFKLNAGVGACIGIKLLLPTLVIAFILLIVTSLVQILSVKKPLEGSFLHKAVSYGCYLSVVAISVLLLLFFGFLSPA